VVGDGRKEIRGRETGRERRVIAKSRGWESGREDGKEVVKRGGKERGGKQRQKNRKGKREMEKHRGREEDENYHGEKGERHYFLCATY
jgi:hypothetical protein